MRKYASRLRWMTSPLSMIRSTASAAWWASSSSVPASAVRSCRVPNVASTPNSGWPEGRPVSVSGASSTWSAAAAAPACGPPKPAARRSSGPRPASAASQAPATGWGSPGGPGGCHGGALISRSVPLSRTASCTACGRGGAMSEVTAARTTLATCSSVAAEASDAPAERSTWVRSSATRSDPVASASREITSRYSTAEQMAITATSGRCRSTASASSTAGAISEASRSRASRTGPLRTGGRRAGRVSRVMLGDSAAAPQAA